MSHIDLPGHVLYDLRSKKVYYPPGEKPYPDKVSDIAIQVDIKKDSAEVSVQTPLALRMMDGMSEATGGVCSESHIPTSRQAEQLEISSRKAKVKVDYSTRAVDGSSESSSEDELISESASEGEGRGPGGMGMPQPYECRMVAPTVAFPSFDGRASAVEWARKAMRIIRAYRIPDDVALALIEDALDGTAANLFEERPEKLRRAAPQEIFNYLIKKCKRQRPVWAAPMSLFALTQNKRESVLDFSLRIQKRARMLGLGKNRHMMLSVFVKGVDGRIATDLIRRDPRTWSEAIDAAQAIEALQNVALGMKTAGNDIASGADRSDRREIREAVALMGKATETMREQMAAVDRSIGQTTKNMQQQMYDVRESVGRLQREANTGRALQTDRKYEGRGQYGESVVCWACGERGHIRRFCPNRGPRARNDTARDPGCGHCGEMGHLECDCWSLRNQVRGTGRQGQGDVTPARRLNCRAVDVDTRERRAPAACPRQNSPR